MLEGIGNRRLFLRFMRSYLLFILLLAVMGGIIYYSSFRTVEEEIIGRNLAILQQSQLTLDSCLWEIDSFLNRIRKRPEIVRLKYAPNHRQNSEIHTIITVRDLLLKEGPLNEFTNTYYFFFNKSSLIVSPYTVYSYDQHYLWKYRLKGFNRQAFEEQFYRRSHNRQIFPLAVLQENPHLEEGVERDKAKLLFTGQAEVLPFVHSIYVEGEPVAGLVVFLDYRKLEALFAGVEFSQGGYLAMVDEEGRLLNPPPGRNALLEELLSRFTWEGQYGFRRLKHQKESFILTYTVSPYNDFKYITIQPARLVLKKVHAVRKTILVTIAVSLLIGIGGSFFFSYRHSLPLIKILNRLRLRCADLFHGRPATLNLLNTAVKEIITRNDHLKREIREQIPLLQSSFYNRLLAGIFHSEQEIRELLSHNRLKIRGTRYCIVLFRFLNPLSQEGVEKMESFNLKRVLLRRIVKELVPESELHFYNDGENHLAWLYCLHGCGPEEGRRDLARNLEAICGSSQGLNLDFIAGVGAFYPALSRVFRSYNEAKVVLDFNSERDGSRILWYDDLRVAKEEFHLPPEIESRLINLTRVGNTQAVGKILAELSWENFAQRRLSPSMKRYFLYNLWSLILKLRPQLGINDPELDRRIATLSQGLQETTAFDEAFRMIVSLFEELAGRVGDKQRSHNRRLKEQILAFIDGNYANPLLCLDMVAGRFAISGTYLSRFFREQTGEYFSDYLENRRLARARDLLISTRLPVTAIMAKTGYGNHTSFARAFKRKNGMTASEYRRLHEARLLEVY